MPSSRKAYYKAAQIGDSSRWQ